MATLRLPEIVRSAAGGEGLSRFHIGDLRTGQGVAADRGNAVFFQPALMDAPKRSRLNWPEFTGNRMGCSFVTEFCITTSHPDAGEFRHTENCWRGCANLPRSRDGACSWGFGEPARLGPCARVCPCDVADSFDVILSDIGLPDGNGYQFLAEIKKRRLEAKTAAVTALSSAADLRAANEAGFDHHFAKPLDLRRLQSWLDLAAAV